MKVKDIQQELDKLLKSRSPRTISELYRLHTYFSDRLQCSVKRNTGILFDPIMLSIKDLAEQHPEYKLSIPENYYIDELEIFFRGRLLTPDLEFSISKYIPGDIDDEDCNVPFYQTRLSFYIEPSLTDEQYNSLCNNIEQKLEHIIPHPLKKSTFDCLCIDIDDKCFVGLFEQIVVKLNEIG